jgi:hypothetical protein
VATDKVTINRAPVLTLWAAVVAERLGFDVDSALTLGKAVAGLNAQSKGRALGIYSPGRTAGGEPAPTRGLGEEFWIELCGREVPAKNTEEGVRAVVKDKPIDPASVRKYLDGKFGDDLAAVREAMAELAQAYDTEDLAEVAFSLYEEFRPQISGGRRGWGQKGDLDLGLIRSMASNAA